LRELTDDPVPSADGLIDCRACNKAIHVAPGDEPTPLCNGCAQSLLIEWFPRLLTAASRAHELEKQTAELREFFEKPLGEEVLRRVECSEGIPENEADPDCSDCDLYAAFTALLSTLRKST
jgi:hypothetical protein